MYLQEHRKYIEENPTPNTPPTLIEFNICPVMYLQEHGNYIEEKVYM